MSRNIDEIITAYGQETDDIASSSKARVELAQLRADLAQVQAERDAFAVELDAMHRAINEMCGTDTSTIEAVQHIINERDAARAELEQMKIDYMTLEIARDALKEILKQYQHIVARR